MKQIFSVTKEDIERRRAKLLEEHPEERKLLKPKKANGSARGAPSWFDGEREFRQPFLIVAPLSSIAAFIPFRVS
jgi:hypothetical protein